MICDPSGLRLYFNEFPRRPPTRVLEAARRALADANRYPDEALAEELKSLMASYSGVGPENVHAASGGEYVFYELFSRLVKPGDRVLLLEPTFTSYEPILRALGAEVHKLRLEESSDRWHLPWDALTSSLSSLKPKLLVVDDPNNPTGSRMFPSEDAVREVCSSFDGHLLLDEAYTEYAGYSSSRLITGLDNLVIFRTMSKAFAMAGMRVSFLLAAKDLIRSIEGFSPRFELSRASLAAAVEALRDPSYASKNAEYIREERSRVRRALLGVGELRVYESLTNFLLMRFPDPSAVERLKFRVMRPSFAREFARLSLGTRSQDDCALRLVREALEAGKALPHAGR